MRFSLMYPAVVFTAACLFMPSAMAGDCVSVPERERLLALDEDAFDQDMQGGWRAVASEPHCQEAAADLIREWRIRHQSTAGILFWHEGQIRASLEDREAAVALFKQSYKPASPGTTAWNAYVDASIAFLTRDKPALLRARENLRQVNPSPEYEVKDGRFEIELNDGSRHSMRWPPNIDVVDGLVNCFDASYDTAYGQSCRAGPPETP